MTWDAEQKMRLLFALRSRGVTDKNVLTAMEQVDRGLFVQGIFAVWLILVWLNWQTDSALLSESHLMSFLCALPSANSLRVI